MNNRKKFAASVALTLGALGCDPQVSEGYAGEVLLSLQGHVVNPGDTDRNLRPVLAFANPKGEVLLVDAEAEGVFPSDFRLRVTEPPPQEVLATGGALASIVLMPAEHPDRLEDAAPEFSSCDPASPEGQCLRTETRCTSDGRCVERDLQCEVELCEVLASSGGLSLLSGESFSRGDAESSYCGVKDCFWASKRCSEGGCASEYRACLGLESSNDFEEGKKIVNCEVLEERGDRSVLELTRPKVALSDFAVLYATEQTEKRSPLWAGELRTGYNLLQIHESDPEVVLAALKCSTDAPENALRQYNQENGTEYTLQHADLEDEVLQALGDLEIQLSLECPYEPIFQVIDKPSSADLVIRLGAPPPSF